MIEILRMPAGELQERARLLFDRPSSAALEGQFEFAESGAKSVNKGYR